MVALARPTPLATPALSRPIPSAGHDVEAQYVWSPVYVDAMSCSPPQRRPPLNPCQNSRNKRRRRRVVSAASSDRVEAVAVCNRLGSSGAATPFKLSGPGEQRETGGGAASQ